MFARVGVHIAWLDAKPGRAAAAAASSVGDSFLVCPPIHAEPEFGSTGLRLPFAEVGKTIVVLCDRIRLVAGGPTRRQRVLAHILAHELDHMRQSTNRHAQTGVRKAIWDGKDHAMKMNPLEFTSPDVDLIREV
jgi:hypothetical protein